MSEFDLDRLQDEAIRQLFQEQQAQEEEVRKQRRLAELNSRKALSLMGDRYADKTFADIVVTPSNSVAIEKCRAYVEKSAEVLKHNIGLYFVGKNGTGKSLLSAVICNELIAKGHTCLFTNFARIERVLLGKDKQLTESELMERIKECDFLFWDDLGKEFLCREFDSSKSKWAEEQLFEVLNARYNAAKPTVFSSNYTIGQLIESLRLDKAIVDRIDEMATRVIKLDGEDFRKQAREQNVEIARGLGI